MAIHKIRAASLNGDDHTTQTRKLEITEGRRGAGSEVCRARAECEWRVGTVASLGAKLDAIPARVTGEDEREE
jgi:hypothetical protein